MRCLSPNVPEGERRACAVQIGGNYIPGRIIHGNIRSEESEEGGRSVVRIQVETCILDDPHRTSRFGELVTNFRI